MPDPPRHRSEAYLTALRAERSSRLYKPTVTKTAISPITKKEPRDAGTSGATT